MRSVAREEGVSEGLVERGWVEAHTVVSAPWQPHVFLGLDGFCVGRPGRMWNRANCGPSSAPQRRSEGGRRRCSTTGATRSPTPRLWRGKHNRIKVLKSRAYRYRNDRSFLLGILSLIHAD